MSQAERKAARWEYFHTLMRDPATGTIPNNVRRRELEYARRLPQVEFGLSKTGAAASFTWEEAGPNDVGGRTRALGVDVDDSNIIIAGGVSGGIWKSIDGGLTWTQKTDPSGPYSITHLAQDTRSGETDTWYAASGEFRGNTASDQGGTAPYRGSGFYISTNNGETWQELHSAGDPTIFDTQFDYISRIVVSPTTGTVFVASNAIGIYRSTDGGANFALALGGTNDHSWSDVAVASDGTLLATLSDGANASPAKSPGVYTSSNDGDTWTEVTPGTYPADLNRSVAAFAPSNSDIAYVFTYEGTVSNDRENVALHQLDLDSGTSDDRTSNLPDFGGKAGFVDTQSAYNMCIAVHPTDENFVLFGTTNLWRSTDGFSSPADDKAEHWVGGYTNQDDSFALYPNQHPDQHVIVFDPNDEDKVWVGHDGGLSLATDITTSTDPMPWTDMNNRYNVTQFYTVATPGTAGDDRLMGGTQDNGTPYFRHDDATSSDISSGDGAYAYFGSSFAFTSSQQGSVLRLGYDGSDNPDFSAWSQIYPDAIDRSNTHFIHPFAVDPGDEEVMYYPFEDHFWRNDALSSIPQFETGTSIGWTEIADVSCPSGYEVSTLAVSVGNPSHRVYYGCYDPAGDPRIFRWDDANSTTDGEVEIPISNPESGAYPHSIAVNPQDGDEILVAFSNYNVVGLYHSDDAGDNYTEVEGNLEGTPGTPGPSLRSVTILPLVEETVYGVGTSTGIYTATQLDGGSTTWEQQGASLMGNAVVEHITSRQSDGQIAAGTHGRGIFTGDPGLLEYGEVSGNGSINTNDAVQVLQHWAMLTTLQGIALTAAEVSGDGDVRPIDASLILQYWANIINCFPVEAGCSPKRQSAASGVLAWGTPEHGGDRLEVPIELTEVVDDIYSMQVEVALPPGVQVEEISSRLPQGWQVVHNDVDGVLKIGTIGTEPVDTGTAFVLSMTTNGPIPPLQATGAVASGTLHELSGEAWSEAPRRFSLAQNFPNPFNPSTQIRYELAEASHVRVDVYNMIGQRVATLVNRQQEAGRYSLEWDVNHLALSSGLYVYTLEAGDFRASKTMMVLK